MINDSDEPGDVPCLTDDPDAMKELLEKQFLDQIGDALITAPDSRLYRIFDLIWRAYVEGWNAKARHGLPQTRVEKAAPARRALRSLAYSVGIMHADYIAASAAIDAAHESMVQAIGDWASVAR